MEVLQVYTTIYQLRVQISFILQRLSFVLRLD